MNKEQSSQFLHLTIKHMNRGCRNGQAYMNALCEIDKELYAAVVGTDADCYYNDSHIKDFLNFIWNY